MFLYILEQQSSLGTSRIRLSWPRSKLKLSPTLASPYEHASCCHTQLVSCCLLQRFKFHTQCHLLSGWLLTNVQVNIITTLHDTRHTCMYITLALLFISSSYTFSIFLGRLAALHSLCPLQ
jgi:hypothetical protein